MDTYVYFVNRIKDCIRRRRENISATDIEVSLADLHGVAESGAYPVPSDIPGGEYEISGEYDIIAMLEADDSAQIKELIDEMGLLEDFERTASSAILATKI